MLRRVLLSLLAFAACAARADAPLPSALFGRLPELTSVDLSPSGAHVVAVSVVNGAQVIAVLDTATGAWTPVQARAPAFERIEWCRFKSERRVVCVVTMVARPKHRVVWSRTHLIAMDIDGSRYVHLLDDRQREIDMTRLAVTPGADGGIVNWLDDDPDHVLMTALRFAYDGVSPQVRRLNVQTGKSEPWYDDGPRWRAYQADRAGIVRARLFIEGNYSYWAVRSGPDGSWRELPRLSPLDLPWSQFRGFASESREVYFLREHQGRASLWAIDADDPSRDRLVFAHPKLDVGQSIEFDGRVVGVRYDDAIRRAYYIDPDIDALAAEVRRQLPGYNPWIVDVSADGKRALVTVESDDEPPVLLLFDRAAGKLRELARTYRELNLDALGSTAAIEYPASDGTSIPAYLTLPPGRAKNGLPLVVMPNDWLLDRWVQRFDYLRAFLVSRGYAVLQMNSRGSWGYGRAWFQASVGEWGGRVHDDIVDGARWAIEQKIADPQRVAILGRGFGGYQALLGAARDGDLFRAAVSIGGFSDLAQPVTMTWSPLDNDQLRLQMGNDNDRLRAQSPRWLAADIRMPVLLIHSRGDRLVRYEQSTLMAEALERAGKPHLFIEMREDNESPRRESNRIAVLAQVEAFLADAFSQPVWGVPGIEPLPPPVPGTPPAAAPAPPAAISSAR